EGSAGAPFFAEGSPLVDARDVRVSTSGLPPDRALENLPEPSAPQDLTWLKKLEMPDIPVRWDARVVRYLEYYKNNSRGRGMVASWIKKSGRYGAAVRRTLREQGVPEDILWLALVESGFDASISSPAGAAGLWQFMPDGAKIYGLTVDRWIDERLDPERATVAAARYLADLHTRFGNWELAFAAYNMGYGGLLAAIRKYNTNDFWELSRLESGMPLETALYVPKIVAMAIVAKNRAVFGCADVELEPSLAYDKIAIGPGVSLKTVAVAADVASERVEELNPQVVAGRTPPDAPGVKMQETWTVRVPAGSGARAANQLVRAVSVEATLARYRVRWGETLDDIATARGVSRGSLAALNGVHPGEVLRPGTLVFVPAQPGEGVAEARGAVLEAAAAKPVVVVPAQAFAYPDRRRAFYRVVAGDTLKDVSGALGVTPDELCRWNALDPAASLHDGMTLQAFVHGGRALDRVALLPEADARVLAVGSPEFFTYFEAQRGRKRVEIA
ncbi:MAG TPA: transglycosylase SLT domain-containing protein, partial [Byssovorax sp.]